MTQRGVKRCVIVDGARRVRFYYSPPPDICSPFDPVLLLDATPSRYERAEEWRGAMSRKSARAKITQRRARINDDQSGRVRQSAGDAERECAQACNQYAMAIS